MSDASTRQTQPIATVVLPGVARVSVLAGQRNVGAGYELAPGNGLTFGADEEKPHPVGEDVTTTSNQARIENLEGVVTLENLAESSVIFVRRRGKTNLAVGQLFKVGDQTLRVVEVDEDRDFTWGDGTQLFTSPRRKGTFAVEHIIEGGRIGASASASEDVVAIGADASALLLGHAPTVSSAHAVVRREEGGQLVLEDQNALNGVFVAVDQKEALDNGALFWVGSQFMRVEITA